MSKGVRFQDPHLCASTELIVRVTPAGVAFCWDHDRCPHCNRWYRPYRLDGLGPFDLYDVLDVTYWCERKASEHAQWIADQLTAATTV